MDLQSQAECICAIPTDISQSEDFFDDETFGTNLDIVTLVAKLWPLGEAKVQQWFLDRF